MSMIDDRGYFDISPELLVQICKGLNGGPNARQFVVVSDALPDTADIARFEFTPCRQFIRVWLSGVEPRQYSPTLATVRDGDPE